MIPSMLIKLITKMKKITLSIMVKSVCSARDLGLGSLEDMVIGSSRDYKTKYYG